MMSKIRITEPLRQVARDTGFLEACTNFRIGEPGPNESAFLITTLPTAPQEGGHRRIDQ